MVKIIEGPDQCYQMYTVSLNLIKSNAVPSKWMYHEYIIKYNSLSSSRIALFSCLLEWTLNAVPRTSLQDPKHIDIHNSKQNHRAQKEPATKSLH